MNKKYQQRSSGIFKSWVRISGKKSVPFKFSEERIIELIILKAKKKCLRYLQAEISKTYKCSCLKGILNSLEILRQSADGVFKNHPHLISLIGPIYEEINKQIFYLTERNIAA